MSIEHLTPRPRSKPLVAIAADRILRYEHSAHSVFEGYVRAVVQRSGALALALPALPDAVSAQDVIDHFDGVVLTGSPSNVAPEHYGMKSPHQDPLLDPQRDSTVLPILKDIIEAGVPVLGICRGFQEINVAWGGTLDPAVHLRPGALDHREGDRTRPIQHWYEDSHSIEVVPGGILGSMVEGSIFSVNSLHHQGIDRLGMGLRVEARAPDGLIEAISVEGASSFAFAVQWHPEMRTDDCPLSQAMFERFGVACLERYRQRTS